MYFVERVVPICENAIPQPKKKGGKFIALVSARRRKRKKEEGSGRKEKEEERIKEKKKKKKTRHKAEGRWCCGQLKASQEL